MRRKNIEEEKELGIDEEEEEKKKESGERKNSRAGSLLMAHSLFSLKSNERL